MTFNNYTNNKTENLDFLSLNTKLNTDFLMLSEKPNTKLKSQINEQNPRSETTNSHGFRERESLFFGHGFRERELGFRPS